MPSLILMRHAKSSWKQAGQRDHQRPLNSRGRADAPAMGRRLVDAGWIPDLALVSDSARTEETWAWMSEAFAEPVEMRLVSELYHASHEAMVDVLSETVTEAHGTVLILAHNPGLEDAIQAWSGELVAMKTSNAVLLTHDADWPTALIRRDWSVSTTLVPPSRDPS